MLKLMGKKIFTIFTLKRIVYLDESNAKANSNKRRASECAGSVLIPRGHMAKIILEWRILLFRSFKMQGLCIMALNYQNPPISSSPLTLLAQVR